MICSGDSSENRALRALKGVNMIRITDKSFRYTPSFNTDLRKKFRKLAQERRAAEVSSRASVTIVNSVVPMTKRGGVPNA